MKMDNFEASASQEFETENFSSSWNMILESADCSVLDENALSLMLNNNEVVIQPSDDIANVLGYGQEILTVDPNASHDLLSLIKDEVTDYPDNSAVSTSVISKPASLPASQNWSGEFGFEISFNAQEKKTKGVTWTYNSDKEKLYVAKEAPCPINFSTDYNMPPNVQIRAMALYSSPESASEVVERCINHIGEDKAKNIPEAEHLVRCESPMAVYEVDKTTKRYSVVIPFENPPPGQSYSTYIFKFTCFGSCPGPNRRPLMLVFSLEKDNQVIGRRKVDVKICACPGRDSKSETGGPGPTKKRKKTEPETYNTVISSNLSVPHHSKKVRSAPNQDGSYNISVKDRKCYEFLEQMKKYYSIMKTVKNMPPDVRKYLEQYQQRKGYKIPPEMNLL